MTEGDWRNRFKGVDFQTDYYKELTGQYDLWRAEQAKADAYRQKLQQGIIDLWQPIRGLNRSHLGKYTNDRLIEIGKVLRLLNELLKQ
jgi:hypothetical protein